MSGGVLNARLSSAAELVRQGAVFADIGTDHAHLPIFLLRAGIIEYAYCADINEGPLASARQNVAEAGFSDKCSFILTDGAMGLSGLGITDFAVCGMGGELIAEIIDRSELFRAPSVRMILQPMTKQERLREYLFRSGYNIICESYSFDAGKYYVCLLAEYTGTPVAYDTLSLHTGLKTSRYIGREARLGYLSKKLSSLERAYRGKGAGGEDQGEEAALIDGVKELITSLK